MDLVIIALRYILLLVLYLFLFRVILLIIRDIRSNKTDPIVSVPNKTNDGIMTAGLIVETSDVPELVEGDKIKLTTENYLGRGSENRIQVADDFTSHRHARLAIINGEYWLEDLNSKNGTVVNGARIDKPVNLVNGDLFQIGGVTFRFERWKNEI